MIGRISGILLEKNPPQLLVDCGGVGYEVDVPMSTYYNLPPLGEKVEGLRNLDGFGGFATLAMQKALMIALDAAYVLMGPSGERRRQAGARGAVRFSLRPEAH